MATWHACWRQLPALAQPACHWCVTRVCLACCQSHPVCLACGQSPDPPPHAWRAQVTHHFLQCIFQHLHITKQLGSSSGGGGGAVASSYAAGGVWAHLGGGPGAARLLCQLW